MEYCSLASGSCGNAHFIRTDELTILLDVGLSARYIKESLRQIGSDMNQVSAVFLTHEHIDHVRGLRVLAKQYEFDLYLHPDHEEVLQEVLQTIDPERIHRLDFGSLQLGDLCLEVFPVHHDASCTLGYTFTQADKTLGIVTDVGFVEEALFERLQHCDVLVLESNHDERLVELGPYPYPLKRRILGEGGHLSNNRAGELIARIYKTHRRLKMALLAHLSQQNNYPDLARMTVHQILEEHEVKADEDLLVEVLHRKQISETYRII